MKEKTLLEYRFTNDILCKMLFVENQHLLKELVSQLLDIPIQSIQEFQILNSEIVPEDLDKKFCRLDILMNVSGQIVDLELQVKDEKNYQDRSLFYWAKNFSRALDKGKDYSDLPKTIVISILDFILFDDADFHNEFQCLNVKTHKPLSEKMELHFYELDKLTGFSNDREIWLQLFKAKTLEDLQNIKKTGVSCMSEVITAYDNITATPKFRELARLREKAHHDEAQAVNNAKRQERELWQAVVNEKDVLINEKDAEIARLRAMLSV